MTDFTMTRSQIIKQSAKRILALKWRRRKAISDYEAKKRKKIDSLVGTKRGWFKVHTLETATAKVHSLEESWVRGLGREYLLYEVELECIRKDSNRLQAMLDTANLLAEGTECRVSLEDARLLFNT